MSQDKSSNINKLREITKQLTSDQLRYLAIRPFVRFDKEAAKEIGLAAETVSRWDNKSLIDEAVKLMAEDGVIVASEILSRYMPQAAREIAEELSHRRVDIRYRAAKEILDRGGLPAARQVEHSGDVVLKWPEDD